MYAVSTKEREFRSKRDFFAFFDEGVFYDLHCLMNPDKYNELGKQTNEQRQGWLREMDIRMRHKVWKR